MTDNAMDVVQKHRESRDIFGIHLIDGNGVTIAGRSISDDLPRTLVIKVGDGGSTIEDTRRIQTRIWSVAARSSTCRAQ